MRAFPPASARPASPNLGAAKICARTACRSPTGPDSLRMRRRDFLISARLNFARRADDAVQFNDRPRLAPSQVEPSSHGRFEIGLVFVSPSREQALELHRSVRERRRQRSRSSIARQRRGAVVHRRFPRHEGVGRSSSQAQPHARRQRWPERLRPDFRPAALPPAKPAQSVLPAASSVRPRPARRPRERA